MSKPLLALWASMIGTGGSLFMSGWAAHAEMWGVLAAFGLVGLAGICCLGFLAMIFVFD